MSFEMEWTPEVKEELRMVFSELVNPVEILVFVGDDCPYCEATVEMIKVFSETSPKKDGKPLIRYRVFRKGVDDEMFRRYNVERVPTVLLIDGYIRYTGIPAGEEVKGLVETIIRISQGESGLDPSIKEKIHAFDGCAYIETIVTPSCPYCPYAVLLANMFAYESWKAGKNAIVSDTVEAYENEDIAYKYNAMSVPTVAINGHVEFVGVPHEDDLLERIYSLGQGVKRNCFERP